MAYILEIKQVVDYPRVRIHRELIQKLIADQSLSSHGDCRLFSFMALCSYANFRSSRVRIDGVSHLIGPGEWICGLREIAGWFRCSKLRQAIAVLDELAEEGFISYSFLPGTKLIRYRILNWGKFNTILEYECRCQKDCGFFFFPICHGKKLMEGKRCSERDVLMDLWLNTIYKDDRVRGSDLGPVIYFRDGTGDPLTSYSRMASRWGLSKATACRIVQKFDQLGYLTCLTFSGRHGTVLYLANYLSVMFEIADMPIDKEEVALKLKLRVKVAAPAVSVSARKISVSKTLLLKMLPKILHILSVQGFACCACKKKAAILSPLSGACEGWILEVSCGNWKFDSADRKVYRFEVHVMDNSG